MLLNIVTASLIGVGVLFEVFVFVFVGDLLIYGDDADNYYRSIAMQPMQSSDQRYDPMENDG